jgi:hypothetical protein
MSNDNTHTHTTISNLTIEDHKAVLHSPMDQLIIKQEEQIEKFISSIDDSLATMENNPDNKKTTYYYGWTLRAKYAADFDVQQFLDCVILPNTESSVWFMETIDNDPTTRHYHGIGRLPGSAKVRQDNLTSCEDKVENYFKIKELLNNHQVVHNNKLVSHQVACKISFCYNTPGWAAYIQKGGGEPNFYINNGASLKWWNQYRRVEASANDLLEASKETKKACAKDKVIYETVIASLTKDNYFIDYDSKMAYKPTNIKGVYEQVIHEGEHITAINLLELIFAQRNIVATAERYKMATAVVMGLKPYTYDDVAGRPASAIKGHSEKLIPFCIRLNHDCIRYKDFAIQIPDQTLITDKQELDKLQTPHYEPDVTIATIEETARAFIDNDEPLINILKNNNQLSIETLSVIYEAFGKRLSSNHRAILNIGISNAGKTTISKYPMSIQPREKLAVLSKPPKSEHGLAPYADKSKFFVDEADKLISQCPNEFKNLADGYPIDVSLKGKNEATIIKNTDVMWCNANVSKYCDFLYEAAILNRVYLLLYNTPYEGSHLKSNEINNQIDKGKYKAIVCLYMASKLFYAKDKDKWRDINFLDQSQKAKIDMLREEFEVVKKKNGVEALFATD